MSGENIGSLNSILLLSCSDNFGTLLKLVAIPDETQRFQEGVCTEWSLECLENNDKVERVAAEHSLEVDFVDWASSSRASKSFNSWQVFTSVWEDELRTFWTTLYSFIPTTNFSGWGKMVAMSSLLILANILPSICRSVNKNCAVSLKLDHFQPPLWHNLSGEYKTTTNQQRANKNSQTKGFAWMQGWIGLPQHGFKPKTVVDQKFCQWNKSNFCDMTDYQYDVIIKPRVTGRMFCRKHLPILAPWIIYYLHGLETSP